MWKKINTFSKTHSISRCKMCVSVHCDSSIHNGLISIEYVWEIARTQSPATKNYAPELPTFGVIAGVSNTGVQW